MASNQDNNEEENNLKMSNLQDSDLPSMIFVDDNAEHDANNETSSKDSASNSIGVSIEEINHSDLESPIISDTDKSFGQREFNSDVKTPALLELDLNNSDSELPEDGRDLKEVKKTSEGDSDSDIKVLEEESIVQLNELDETLSNSDDPNINKNDQNNRLEQPNNKEIIKNRFWVVLLVLRTISELKNLKIDVKEGITSAQHYLLMDLFKFVSTDDRGDVKNLTFDIFENYNKYSDLLNGKDWNQCFQFIGDVIKTNYATTKELIFGSYNTNYVCPSCQEQSSKLNERCCFPLNLNDEDYSTIKDVLDQNLNPLVDVKCGKCDTKLKCVVKIQSAPLYLVLTFNRFHRNKWITNTFNVDDGYIVEINGKDTLFSLKAVIDFQLSDRVYAMKYRGDDTWMEYGMEGTSICSEYNIISSKTLAVVLKKID